MMRTKVSTVILSDVHIGSEHAKVKELTSFLKNVDCDKLILNGIYWMAGSYNAIPSDDGKENIPSW